MGMLVDGSSTPRLVSPLYNKRIPLDRDCFCPESSAHYFKDGKVSVDLD